tara:strand:+ start:2658 stop:2789 length:132 start_codon:yes stop_codon:yes gene_type:complete
LWNNGNAGLSADEDFTLNYTKNALAFCQGIFIGLKAKIPFVKP